MTAMTTDLAALPWSRPVTAEEFFALDTPDDGTRIELIDGVLVMSPSPMVDHQWNSGQLYAALFAACPGDLRCFAAPLDVQLSFDTVVEPDLLVIRTSDIVDNRVAGVPLLAVEILSPSTRGNDLLLKRRRYERAGIPSYWVIDPRTGEMVVWQLDSAGEYAETARGLLYDEPLTLDEPFPVTLRLTR